MRRLLLPLAAATAALLLPAPASAIVNGEAAGGDPAHGVPLGFPAQVFVGGNTDGIGDIDRYCSGTLVGSRQVLTATRCTRYGLNNSQKLPPPGYDVRVGDVQLETTRHLDVTAPAVDYNGKASADDVSMLTLAQPVYTDVVRVVDVGEDALWAPGTRGRVLGWGENEAGFLSSVLRKGDVGILPDDQCDVDTKLVLCAAGESQNPCAGDSGSPLLVPDGGFFALAGVFSGTQCSTTSAPGRYARVGNELLNVWIHSKTPEADFDLSHQPRAGEPVTLTSMSRHPEGAGYFTTFRWDLDNDGAFDDASGRSVSHAFPTAGEGVAGLEASRPGGDKASIYYRFAVEPAPVTTTLGPPTSTNAPTRPVLARILSAKRPKVKRGHFAIRIRFAKTAPKGTAVIEVYRSGHRIGIARTKVRRGATKRVRVKLMRRGRRALRRSSNHRLKVRVRVRVGRTILRTKRLTLRR
jgi:trypsin